MLTPDKILVTMLESPGSAEAIGAICRIPELVAKANMQRHQAAGLVKPETLHGVVFWSLTPAGEEKAKSLNSTELAL